MLRAILAGARFSIADEILAIFAICFGSILFLTFSIQWNQVIRILDKFSLEV